MDVVKRLLSAFYGGFLHTKLTLTNVLYPYYYQAAPFPPAVTTHNCLSGGGRRSRSLGKTHQTGSLRSTAGSSQCEDHVKTELTLGGNQAICNVLVFRHHAIFPFEIYTIRTVFTFLKRAGIHSYRRDGRLVDVGGLPKSTPNSTHRSTLTLAYALTTVDPIPNVPKAQNFRPGTAEFWRETDTSQPSCNLRIITEYQCVGTSPPLVPPYKSLRSPERISVAPAF